ncbi:MAG: FG-GAP repeat domain-containing protein, partial [Candidatus Dormibacteraceae bacterium]
MLTLADSTGIQSSAPLDSRFRPSGTVFTQVVMGDFNGDGLADPLVFYASVVSGSQTQWGMRALTAADPTKAGSLKEGPEFYGDTDPVPVTGSIVVGDFNGDGRDEIAFLRTDYHTVAFYSVDPNTLVIAHITTIPLTANLPNGGGSFPITMVPGQVALAAGRFRQCGGNGSACQGNGITNADLVVFGQIDKIENKHAPNGYSVIPIRITPPSSGAFTASVVPAKNATETDPFFRFPDYHGASGALAQAAPLALWPQQTDEQVVLGIRTEDGASYIQIGSFLPDDGALDTFDWESETEREYGPLFDRLQNMWVGNFDNLDADGKTHNPTWQIETYELVNNPIFNGSIPHINIFDVKIPSPFPTEPPKKTNWLEGQQKSDNTSGIPTFNSDMPSLGFLAPSDMQGRSLRLGAPTIVRIPTQTQPDLVLATPPMHIDYIAPQDSTLANANAEGGCNNETTPCIVNLTVMPSEPPSQGQGFASSFNFTSSTNTSSKRASTTSWGISTRTSVGASFSFNDGLENASGSIKDTTRLGHDETVKKTYGTYAGITESLSATTGLADYLYFTQKAMNIYYYPVLGCDSAGASTCWVDGQKVP